MWANYSQLWNGAPEACFERTTCWAWSSHDCKALSDHGSLLNMLLHKCHILARSVDSFLTRNCIKTSKRFMKRVLEIFFLNGIKSKIQSLKFLTFLKLPQSISHVSIPTFIFLTLFFKIIGENLTFLIDIFFFYHSGVLPILFQMSLTSLLSLLLFT